MLIKYNQLTNLSDAYSTEKEKFAAIREKVMLRRTKALLADQLPSKGIYIKIYVILSKGDVDPSCGILRF